MLTIEQVEEILNEIVGPDERIIDIQFPNVGVDSLHPERYETAVDRILTRMIEVSRTTGPMTFGYGNLGGLEPPEAGDREPRHPHPSVPTIAAELPEPSIRSVTE